MIYGQNFPPEYILCTFTRRRCAAYNKSMDALTLLLLYLVTQNPDFQCKLAPFADKLKESEDMLKFLNSLSAFPCAPNAKPCEGTEKPCNDPCDCDPPCGDRNPTGSTGSTGGTGGVNTGSTSTGSQPSYTGTTKKNGPSEGKSDTYRADDFSPLRSVGGEWLEKYVTKYFAGKK